MADSPEILAAKQDGLFLRQVLRIQSDRVRENHAKCPMCGDTTLRYGPSSNDGVHLWQCMKGCGKGSVVDALVIVDKMPIAQAMDECRKRYSGKSPKKTQYQQFHENRAREVRNGQAEDDIRYGNQPEEPVIDEPRANKFIDEHHDYLLQHLGQVQRFKRGISADVIKKYRIGYAEMVSLKGAPWLPPMTIPGAWVIPITNATGKLRGVKLHFEERPVGYGGKQGAKCLWAPFGTQPAYQKVRTDSGLDEIKPRHSAYGLWPHPETLNQSFSYDFSLAMEWWLERMPKFLHERWAEQVETQRLLLAESLSVNYEDLNPEHILEADNSAYKVMQKEIIRAVSKAELKPMDDSHDIDWSKWTFICPGELKALAVESYGLMATSITGGEGWIPGPDWLKAFYGQQVCVVFDNDPTKRNKDGKTIVNAGLNWARMMTAALMKNGAWRVIAKNGGQKSKGEALNATLKTEEE